MVWTCEAGRRESFGLARVRINEVQISEGLLYSDSPSVCLPKYLRQKK